MKITLFLLLMAFSFSLLNAQHHPRQAYRLVDGPSYTQSKNVYLLTLFQSLPEVREILKSDPVLRGVADRKAKQLSTSLKNCGDNAFCYSEKLPFSPDEVEEIAQRLQELTQSKPTLRGLVEDHLIPSGKYQMQETSFRKYGSQRHGNMMPERSITLSLSTPKAKNPTIQILIHWE